MYLVEHFYSFQGEGRYIGRPSIFFRFGGCNLNCEGFNSSYSVDKNVTIKGCDSLFASKSRYFKSRWKKISNVDELFKILDSYQKELKFKPDIVLTGGEPLIYHKNRIFYQFVSNLKEYRVSVETNSTIKIDFDRYPNYKNLIYALSIKLSNSRDSREKRLNKQAINNLIENSKESFFKFVIDRNYIEKYSNSEIEDLVKNRDIETYCMPLGATIEALDSNRDIVIDFCKKFGYTYTDRLHIRLFQK